MLEFFVSNAFANEVATTAAKQPSMLASMLPMIGIMAVFYFLIIRPQNKKLNEHKALLNAIKKGDQIITAGGVYADVVKVNQEANTVQVEIAEGVKVMLKLDTIVGVVETKVEKAEKPAAPAKKKKA